MTTEEDHVDHQLEMNLFAKHVDIYHSITMYLYVYIYTAFSVHVVPIISIISLMYYYIHTHIDTHALIHKYQLGSMHRYIWNRCAVCILQVSNATLATISHDTRIDWLVR